MNKFNCYSCGVELDKTIDGLFGLDIPSSKDIENYKNGNIYMLESKIFCMKCLTRISEKMKQEINKIKEEL